MAITLSQKYLDELRHGVNTPNVVIEIALDSGKRYLGYHGFNTSARSIFLADGSYAADGSVYAVGSDEINLFVEPMLKSVSSLQNKIDPSQGFTTRGELKIVISGRDNFKGMIRDEYLKNRRVTRKDGFISPGFTYADYAATFTGLISDWSRKGDEVTITVSDDLADAGSTKIPVENEDGTQFIDYLGRDPAFIIQDILSNQLGIDAGSIDSGQFTSEKDTWLNNWTFSRVITEPKEANTYLNELQVETNSFVVHDGEKITFKVFSPPLPGAVVDEWNDRNHIILDSFSQRSGYKDNFFNRLVVYYDYDESGSDDTGNFDSAVISFDAGSQDASEWDEASTKTIKSKWIRSYTHAQPVNITGVIIYHASKNNGEGAGTLSFTYDANGNHTLTWTAPGGAVGAVVTISQAGKYDVYSSDETKCVRVIVDYNNLPAANKADSISITPINGGVLAATVANKLLSRYRNPAAIVAFEVDIDYVASGQAFIKPTDIKEITTGEACEFGVDSWVRERVMLTSVRPDFSSHRVKVEAVGTKMYRNYGFVAPAGQPDYPSASTGQREYAYVGDADNKINGGTEDGFYIW